MSVVLIDGFDVYNGIGANTGVGAKWTLGTNYTLQPGRFTGQCLKSGAGSGAQTAQRSFPGAYTSCGAGFAFMLGSLPNTEQITFLGSSGTVKQVFLLITSAGAIQVKNGASVSLGISANGVIIANQWHYIEVGITVSDTVGAVTVTVDSVPVLTLTGVDTKNGTSTTIDAIRFNYNVVGAFHQVDDLYVVDSATTVGERRVQTLYPSADTVSKDFAASTGTSNYACVDEAQVDTTDFVNAGVVGNLDLYELDDVGGTPSTIDAVQITAFAEKTDANTRAFALVADIAGTQTQSSDFSLTASYGKFEQLMTAKPGGGAWDLTAVNALRAGPKVTV